MFISIVFVATSHTASHNGLDQIYTIASAAREKLAAAASKADHDLRRIVGLANFLGGDCKPKTQMCCAQLIYCKAH